MASNSHYANALDSVNPTFGKNVSTKFFGLCKFDASCGHVIFVVYNSCLFQRRGRIATKSTRRMLFGSNQSVRTNCIGAVFSVSIP